MRGRRSRWFQTALGGVISLALIAWLVVSIEWAKVWHDLLRVHYLIFIPVTLLILIQFVVRALRWRYLLPGERPVGLATLFDGIMLANFGNYFLPLRAGEFMRPLLVMRETKASFSSCFVSVVVERFFDLATVLISFAVILSFLPDLPPVVYQGAGLLSVLALGLLAFIVLGVFVPGRLLALVDLALRLLPAAWRSKLRRFIEDFLSGTAVFSQRGRFFAVVALTLIVWLLTFLQYYLALFMFPGSFSFLFGVTIAVVLALGVAAPSAPGFIGVFQFACVIAFGLFGFEKEPAATYSILCHVHQYIIVTVFGLLVLVKYSLKIGDLLKRSE